MKTIIISLSLFFTCIINCLGQQNYKEILASLKPKKTNEAFLISLNAGDKYVTYYFEFKENKIVKERDLNCLVSPQKDRFYYIQEAHSVCAVDYKDSHLNGEPVEISETNEETVVLIDSSFAGLQNRITAYLAKADSCNLRPEESLTDEDNLEEEQELETYHSDPQDEIVEQTVNESKYAQRVDYIIPGYFNLYTYGGGTGGAHPSYSEESSTFVFNKGFAREKANFSTLFPPEKWNTFKRTLFFQGVENRFDDWPYHDLPPPSHPFDLSKYDGVSADSVTAEYHVNTDDPDFILYRKNGVVNLLIQAHAYAGYIGDYDLTTSISDIPVGKPVIGYNNFPLSFQALKNLEPKMIDAFVSPNQNVVFILLEESPEKIYALKAIDVRSGNIILDKKMPNQSFAQVIMAEWATGKYTESWFNALK